MTCRQAFLGDGPPPANRKLASYAAKDAEDLQRAIVAGQVDVVVVCDIGVLIAAMLDGDICLNDWAAHGVSLEIAGRDSNPARTAVAFATTTLTAAQTSITTWHARLRRRRTIAGAILSVIAIACAAALTALAR